MSNNMFSVSVEYFLYISSSHPPSMPAWRWPSMVVSMTMTLSCLHSPGWHRPWPLNPSPHQHKTRKSAPRREPASVGSGLCVKTWTCWWATAIWSTRTPAWPSLCPTCSSTSSTGACTRDQALRTLHQLVTEVKCWVREDVRRVLLSTGLQALQWNNCWSHIQLQIRH